MVRLSNKELLDLEIKAKDSEFIRIMFAQVESELRKKLGDEIERIVSEVIASIMLRVAKTMNMRTMQNEIIFSAHIKNDAET